MPEEDIIVEFEAHLAYKGEKLKECPCGCFTHAGICPECGEKVTGDKLVDQMMRDISAGKDVDLEQLRPNLDTKTDTFVPIDGDLT